ncbi:MAG: hypothetical protein ACI4CY_05625 [Candidatus Gastranaerophilaceae bacterium]
MIEKDNINFFLPKEDKANFKINAIKENTDITKALRLFINAFNKNPKKVLKFLK